MSDRRRQPRQPRTRLGRWIQGRQQSPPPPPQNLVPEQERTIFDEWGGMPEGFEQPPHHYGHRLNEDIFDIVRNNQYDNDLGIVLNENRIGGGTYFPDVSRIDPSAFWHPRVDQIELGVGGWPRGRSTDGSLPLRTIDQQLRDLIHHEGFGHRQRQSTSRKNLDRYRRLNALPVWGPNEYSEYASQPDELMAEASVIAANLIYDNPDWVNMTIETYNNPHMRAHIDSIIEQAIMQARRDTSTSNINMIYNRKWKKIKDTFEYYVRNALNRGILDMRKYGGLQSKGNVPKHLLGPVTHNMRIG